MTIKDVVKLLEKLPQDATIGTVSFDEESCLHGRNGVTIRMNSEMPDEIEKGSKNLDYYIEC